MRSVVAIAAIALLCGCLARQARTAASAGEVRAQHLLVSGTSYYLRAKYLPAAVGSRRSLFERAKAQFEAVLNDPAASDKSKREAADMLDKVEIRLEGGAN